MTGQDALSGLASMRLTMFMAASTPPGTSFADLRSGFHTQSSRSDNFGSTVVQTCILGGRNAAEDSGGNL